MKKIALLPLTTLALTACVPTLPMYQPPAPQPAFYQHFSNQVSSPLLSRGRVVGEARISLDSEEPEVRMHGLVMTVTTSDGEAFTGLVLVNERDVGRRHERVINTHGRYAVLTGNHGRGMNCQFEAADRNSNIIDGGAVGSCQVSDGRYFSLRLDHRSVETNVPAGGPFPGNAPY